MCANYRWPEILADMESDPFQAAHLAVYRRVAARLHGRRVLDLGSGYGWGAMILAESADAVVGVDIEPERIAFAKEICPFPNVSFLVGSLPDVPLSQPFDAVCLVQVLQHLADPGELLGLVRERVPASGLILVAAKANGNWADMPPEAIGVEIRRLARHVGLATQAGPVVHLGIGEGIPDIVEVWLQPEPSRGATIRADYGGVADDSPHIQGRAYSRTAASER